VIEEGMSFSPPEPYEVTQDEVRTFSHVLGQPIGEYAPPTFVNAVLEPAIRLLLASGVFDSVPAAVHTSEAVSYQRLLKIGDLVTTRLEVTGVRQRSSVTQFDTLGVLTTADGSEIARVKSTLAYETLGPAE
jgi:acyl dehydratase